MKERPILFSGAMVRAILSGAKTQTRRIVKPQPVKVTRGSVICGLPVPVHPDDYAWPDGPGCVTVSCKPNGPTGWAEEHSPYGQPGDRLWVREAFCTDVRRAPDLPQIVYAADYASERPRIRWRPSIHMPRWASRITLEITSMRVERLNDINEADAIAEGVTAVSSGGVTLFTTTGVNCFQTAKDAYAALWESINGPGSWDANPWVWVVEFRRVAA